MTPTTITPRTKLALVAIALVALLATCKVDSSLFCAEKFCEPEYQLENP